MLPKGHRSIRDIPVSSHPKKRATLVEEAIIRAPLKDDTEDEYMEPIVRKTRSRPNRRRWLMLWAVVVILICAIGGFLLSTLFAGATITIYPRTEQVAAPKTLIAKINPAAGELPYRVMTVTRSASTTVPASGTRQVSRSASGTITIYNAYGTEKQRLIANTRFAAPDGKIYRLKDSVVVPGAVKNPDNTLTPGALSVTVTADSPGAAYNRGETRFTIPGFKGDPRYDKFYAQGVSISGGFVGTEPAVASADLAQATELIKQGLSQDAQSAFVAQVQPGYIAVPGSLLITFGPLSQTPAQGNSATLAQTASISSVVLRVSDLAMKVAQETVKDYKGETIAFEDVAALSLTAATSTKQNDVVTLMLEGAPTLIWQYDPAALKAALVGKNKATFQSIIESFAPAIKKAEAKVRPFWDSSFPDDPSKITIVEGK